MVWREWSLRTYCLVCSEGVEAITSLLIFYVYDQGDQTKNWWLSDCNIHLKQIIALSNETKWCKIWLRLRCPFGNLDNFWGTLPKTIVNGLCQYCRKCCSKFVLFNLDFLSFSFITNFDHKVSYYFSYYQTLLIILLNACRVFKLY